MQLSKLLSERPETQAELAAKVGVFQTTVGYWQRGETLPPSTRIPALAAALGINAEALRKMVARDRIARRRLHARKSAKAGAA